MAHLISEDCLLRFARGKATREEMRRIVAHLLRGCPACSQVLQAYAEPALEAPSLDGLLDRSSRSLLSGLDRPAPSRARRPSSDISH